jgi:RIO kinase 1
VSISLAGARPAPPWLITDSFEDRDAGVLKSGKEAEVFLVERVSAAGSCLLAHKRYRPRYPKKGELEALGFSKGTIYRADKVYQAGWNLKRRERWAVDGGSRFGEKLAARLWPQNENNMLTRAWRAGASVPFPVELTEDGVLMEYVGARSGAAPRLAGAGLSRAEVAVARDQLLDSLLAMASDHIVHADLSVYNVLWWRGRIVVIDFPQAVDATENPHAPDLLHRDLVNVAAWFSRRGAGFDPERMLSEMLAVLW